MRPIDALKIFDDNPLWKHQIVRLISEVKDGGGDFIEILWTCNNIRSGDVEDWYIKWRRLAEEVEKRALESLEAGRAATSRKLFLKACNYYRMANFFLSLDDPRDVETHRKIVECFSNASKFFRHGFESVSINFLGHDLPGYFIYPDKDGRGNLPVVIMFGGLDAVKEEYYFRGALDCIERGMACLLIEGPGQGLPLRRDRLYLTHEYEKPVSSIIDYLERRGDVDGKRIALVGSSLGGYFALRAAAFEHRLSACVALSAIYDLKEDVYDFFPPIRRRLNEILGAKAGEEPLERVQLFTLKGLIRNIRCPLLIVHGESDYLVSINAAYKVYEEASCEKTLKVYKKDELGSHHIQHDHLDEAKSFVFDWIAEKVKK